MEAPSSPDKCLSDLNEMFTRMYLDSLRQISNREFSSPVINLKLHPSAIDFLYVIIEAARTAPDRNHSYAQIKGLLDAFSVVDEAMQNHTLLTYVQVTRLKDILATFVDGVQMGMEMHAIIQPTEN